MGGALRKLRSCAGVGLIRMEAMMGADIHLYVERRLPSGNWVCVRDLNENLHSSGMNVMFKTDYSVAKGEFTAYWDLVGRSYELFARLAGVRGDGPEPRGLPDDVSEFVEHEYDGWNHDAHSASWYSADDFVQIYAGIDGEVDDDTPLNEYVVARMEQGADIAVYRFLREMAGLYVEDKETADDYRFVFWFDN